MKVRDQQSDIRHQREGGMSKGVEANKNKKEQSADQIKRSFANRNARDKIITSALK